MCTKGIHGRVSITTLDRYSLYRYFYIFSLSLFHISSTQGCRFALVNSHSWNEYRPLFAEYGGSDTGQNYTLQMSKPGMKNQV